MFAFLLVSNALLWIALIVIAALVLGNLRLLHELRQRLGYAETEGNDSPSIAEDGPGIGTRMQELHLPLIDSTDISHLPQTGQPCLLIFMSHMCATCQDIADAVNRLVATERIRIVVIMRANRDGCLAFKKVYGFKADLYTDEDTSMTRSFGIHHSPFALFYDENGLLVRKGVIGGGWPDFMVLLGESRELVGARDHIFPVA